MANMPLPKNTVPTWILSQRLLNTGLTGASTHGMADEMIIRQAEKGATNEPSTISLNLNWKTRKAKRMVQEKKERADFRFMTGAVPKR